MHVKEAQLGKYILYYYYGENLLYFYPRALNSCKPNEFIVFSWTRH